ncbi:MAG: Asp-tRNA(Asn)/Glu-tRNA(Gln) amidotransferase subunit GatC [Clostridia bacterium]|nr:Asp-tRNA(Asn)/Glu-tRNA(Gln) amidotransferase subunit GatC [Clostridia bacterium]
MKIDKEQVRHVAALAKLRFEESELEAFGDSLGAIIAFADQLNELDVGTVGATAQSSDLYNVFREDEQKASYPREVILANAPEQCEGCYAVPKIVE